jgi:UMF1 family MFS transporter
MRTDAGVGSGRVYTREAVAWALFDFSNTVFSMNVVSRFAALWIKQEKGGADLHFASAIVVSLVAASVVNVLLAPLSDAMGRRAVFVRVFGLTCAGATAALGLDPSLWPALVLLALASFGNQSAIIFWTAMLGDVSRPRTLGKISGLGAALSYVGSVLGLLVVERMREEGAPITHVFVPTAAVYLLVALPQFLLVRDAQPRAGADAGAALRRSWRELVMIVRMVWQHRPLRWFMVALLLYSDVIGTLTLFMAVYAHQTVGMSDDTKMVLWLSEISLYLIAATVFAVISGILIGQVADRFNKLSLLAGVLTVWTVALALAVVANAKWALWIAGPMIGLCWGGVAVLSRALLIELGWPEHRTKLFTVFALIGRAAGIIGPLLWGLVVYAAAPLGAGRYRIAAGMLVAFMCAAIWFLRLAMREQRAAAGPGHTA